MRVYCFDHNTFAYVASIEAERSPLEPGRYLVPAFATLAPPPERAQGQVAVFDPVLSEWTLQELPPPPEPEPQADPEAPPRPPEPSSEERLEALRNLVQEYLDAMARAWGYDDIRSAVTYAEEPAVPRFQAEGKALRAWRSMVWSACYELLARVQAGDLDEPSGDELIGLLPRLERLPEVDELPPPERAARDEEAAPHIPPAAQAEPEAGAAQ